MQFNPAFTVLFDACEPLLHLQEPLPEHVRPPEALGELLEAAHRAHATEREVFEYALQGTKSLDLLVPIVARARDGFARRLEGLHLLQGWAESHEVGTAQDGLLALERGQGMLAETLPLISALDGKTRFSPFPPLNDFIQAGLNVRGDTQPVEVLVSRLPFVVGFVLSLEGNWRSLVEIGEVPPERAARGYALVASLQEAIGAVQVWLDEGDAGSPINLLAGLHLLIEGSRELQGMMKELQEAFPAGSAGPDVKRLSLRMAREGVEGESIPEAIAAVEEALRRLEGEMNTIGVAFLPLGVREKYQGAMAEALQLAWEALERVRAGEEGVEALEMQMRLFDQARADLAHEAGELWPDLARAPRFNQLRAIILGVHQGSIPLFYLRALEAAFSRSLEELGANMLSADASEILALQQQGAECLRAFLENGDREALVEGWFCIHEAVMRTDAIAEEAAARERQATQGALCVKCGMANPPGSSHCQGCKAFLPFSKSLMSDVSDFAIAEGGPAPGCGDDSGVPENIARLAAMVQQFRETRAIPEDMPGFVETLISYASAAQKNTEKSLASLGAEERQDGERFIALSARFESGLVQVQEALGAADEDRMGSGLDAVRAAALELVAFQRPR